MVTGKALRVQMIARPGRGHTGTSRYADDLYRAVRAAGTDVVLTRVPAAPALLGLTRVLKREGVDLDAFFDSYPLGVGVEQAEVYHLASQTLATLLLFQRFPGPTVVSVLDVIPWLTRRDPALNTLRHPMDVLFYRLALVGLRRAQALIAISEHTRRTLVQTLRLPQERIRVIHPSVDLNRFRPTAVPQEFRLRYGLGEDVQYVLFVGSDDPRKDLPMLLRAFSDVRKRMPRARLLKVGAAQDAGQRTKHLALVSELGLQDTVRFFDGVPDEDLPLFYNAADLVAMPSRWEGFGLPVLEAMACGRPVLVSNAEALQEIVGGAWSPVPSDAHAWAEAICLQLQQGSSPERCQDLRNRASEFSWSRAAERIVPLYRSLSREAG